MQQSIIYTMHYFLRTTETHSKLLTRVCDQTTLHTTPGRTQSSQGQLRPALQNFKQLHQPIGNIYQTTEDPTSTAQNLAAFKLATLEEI